MNREEIEHLAGLARITLSEAEADSLTTELENIIGYVSSVSSIAADEADAVPTVGAVHNIFRADKITNQPGEYTDAIVAEMPESKDGYLKVHKILQTDE